MSSAFAEFRKKYLGVRYECATCGVFATLTEATRPKQFDQCQCGKCAVDWGDGFIHRLIGQPIRKEVGMSDRELLELAAMAAGLAVKVASESGRGC